MNTIKFYLSVLKSVLASFLGVQSHNKYAKDSHMTSFTPFLIVGIVMVIALVMSIYILVNVVMSLSAN